MSENPEVRRIAATTHGRVLVHHPRTTSRGLLVGFHGYLENADIQLERVLAIPGALEFTVLSVQGLHRVYRGRTDEVVASWMTRQDRESAIADNLAYVDAAVASALKLAPPLVYAGFSQGAAMAFRAAVRGAQRASGVIAVGGDVPPELLSDAAARFPPVLLARGERDEFYDRAKFDADFVALVARRTRVTPLVFEGGHEWNAATSFAAGEFLAEICPTRP